ncbi:hypothetical protein [Nocardia sp. CC201C]|uniref:hypothetical protein n=1 Tax=Nocardia sp. CC201C TaxID=3044575 RepID=UPI0024A911CC|nr:hypothetical protein [Nocardia sp. CC201C]
MPAKMTPESTGLTMAEELYPLIPDTDDLKVASEIFAFAHSRLKDLRRDLDTVLAECEEQAPFAVTHTKHLSDLLAKAHIGWFIYWPHEDELIG